MLSDVLARLTTWPSWTCVVWATWPQPWPCDFRTRMPGKCVVVTVVVAAHGYPGSPRSGDEVLGVDEASALEGVTVLHAGTARTDDGRLVTAGGRVLSVVGTGPDLATARERAYAGVRCITIAGGHHRGDIAEVAAGQGAGRS